MSRVGQMSRQWSIIACNSPACSRARVYSWHPGDESRQSIADVSQLLVRAALADGWAKIDGDWYCGPCFRRWALSAEWTTASTGQLDRITREYVAATRIEVR